MKHLFTSFLIFLSYSIFAQYHHSIGFQLTGQYYFDGRKFYFQNNKSRVRFPGISYTYYLDKKNKSHVRIGFEKFNMSYNFNLVHGEVINRRNSIFNLSYGYSFFRFKNLILNTNFGILLRKNSDIYLDYASFSTFKELVFYYENSDYHFGNEISLSINYLILNQLNLYLYFSYSKLYGSYYNDLLQSGLGISYKF